MKEKWGWGIETVVAVADYFLIDDYNGWVYAVNGDFITTAAQSTFNFYDDSIDTPDFIAAKSSSLVVVHAYNYPPPSHYWSSTDGGNNFAIAATREDTGFQWGYLRLFATDITNGDIWAVIGYVSGDNDDESFLDVSTDGGQTWNYVFLHAKPDLSHAIAAVHIAPRYDGSTAWVYTAYYKTTDPNQYHWDYCYIDLVDNTGSVLETYLFDASTVLGEPEGQGIWTTGGMVGNSDLFSAVSFNYGDLWQLEWSTKTWTKQTGFTPTGYQNQILSSRLGTLFIYETPIGGGVIINRSTDGINWSPVTLPISVPTPVSRSMMIGTSNQLAFFVDGGTFIHSEDDGVTWTQSAVVSGLEDATVPDQCGAAT